MVPVLSLLLMLRSLPWCRVFVVMAVLSLVGRASGQTTIHVPGDRPTI